VYADLDALVRLQFQARGFSFLPRQPIHSLLAGRHASRLRGRGLNFEELRGYLPGDDIRNLDWKVTARTREPHVRVYTEERDRSVWLLVDQRVSMFFGSRRQMKSVLAAEAAALSAWRVLAAGDRVGAVVFGDDGVELVAPHRSENNVRRILSRIVAFNHRLDARTAPPARADRLNEALRRVAPLARHDCLVVLITDGFGIDGETRRRITRLTEHNDVIAVFTFDEMERELAGAGRGVFSDGEKQLDVDAGARRVREGFREAFETRLERMKDASRRFAIPLLPVHTGRPVAEQVRELIGRRRRPGRA
jgi:uncharacterized protein (DUF58 family)